MVLVHVEVGVTMRGLRQTRTSRNSGAATSFEVTPNPRAGRQPIG